MFKARERRTLHLSVPPDAARRVLCSRLTAMRTDIPRAWLGGRLTPGVIAFMFGNWLVTVPVPPERTLLASRNAPLVLSRIVPRPEGGSDLRLSVYTPGFPYRIVEDPIAARFFDDWLTAVGDELGA